MGFDSGYTYRVIGFGPGHDFGMNQKSLRSGHGGGFFLCLFDYLFFSYLLNDLSRVDLEISFVYGHPSAFRNWKTETWTYVFTLSASRLV